MHELTIAQNIISIIEDELQQRNKLACQVNKVYFNTGRLNAVVPESLQYNFNQIKKERKFTQNAELIIKEIPITIKCEDCQAETQIDEPVFKCQNCSSRQIKVIAGKKMYIESMDIE
ncbi:MAG: hydrogenase maturation nickel metallochaperone HypA [Candidatus Marinimicrobia bacterium]|nr:hydrogenase maturation nickel metallochaperone HypA [Candidatus Neomarinimicrobiota bacterium]